MIIAFIAINSYAEELKLKCQIELKKIGSNGNIEISKIGEDNVLDTGITPEEPTKEPKRLEVETSR